MLSAAAGVPITSADWATAIASRNLTSRPFL
jgi:hypothetical protein